MSQASPVGLGTMRRNNFGGFGLDLAGSRDEAIMREPDVEYPLELLDDPSLPFSERVDRKLARDDMDWEASQEAYGNVIVLPCGEVSGWRGAG